MGEKIYIWDPSTCICKYGKYSENIIGEKIVEQTKAIPTKTDPT